MQTGVAPGLARLREALWLSAVLAATAALVAVPAGAAEFLLHDLFWATWGKRVDTTGTFHDVARMWSREVFTVDFDWSTPAARWQRVRAQLFQQVVCNFHLAIFYTIYLGASAKVCCVVLGSAVVATASASLAYYLSGVSAFVSYSPVLGGCLLVAALILVCPRGSKIHRQAFKQLLVVMMGNALLVNVIAEKTVGWLVSRFRVDRANRSRGHTNELTECFHPRVRRIWYASCKRLCCSTCSRRRAGSSSPRRRIT
jgi:hypothetical protein